MKNLKKTALLLAVCLSALLTAGCSDEETQLRAAFEEFSNNCKGNVSAEFYVGQWNRYLTVRCDEIIKGK